MTDLQTRIEQLWETRDTLQAGDAEAFATVKQAIDMLDRGEARRWLRDTSVRVGVNNLFNTEPPLSNDNNTYEPALYNTMAKGRLYSLTVTRKF